MSSENERTLAILTSRDDRLKSYLCDAPSPDDIVRDVTMAFAGDVARIMASVPVRRAPAVVAKPAAGGISKVPSRSRVR